MANYKMYPGSRQKNSKGTFRKSQESVVQKLFRVGKQVLKDVSGVHPGVRVIQKAKQIRAKKQATRTIKPVLKKSVREGMREGMAEYKSMTKRPMKSLSRKPKAVASTIKPRGIQTTPTPKPKATTMPTSKKAMSISKNIEPKPKPNIKKVKEKVTTRGRKRKVKYYKK